MAKIGIKFMKGGKVYCVESDIDCQIDDCVVVESERGLELAYISSVAKNSDKDNSLKIVRKATKEDVDKMENLKKNAPNVLKITNKLIAKYKLDMKLVDVSYTLDGSKVIISYICEDRVDFRRNGKKVAIVGG